MDTQNYPWSNKLTKVMQSSIFTSLATVDKDLGVWICTVNFAFNENFQLYFLSKRTSRHVQNLKIDPRVSLSIYRTTQKPHENVIGIQMAAKAEVAPDEEMEKICGYYFGRENPFFDAEQTKEYYDWDATWKFVKIMPEKIWIYDSETFGDSKVLVPNKIFTP